jgi:hypothetical protein
MGQQEGFQPKLFYHQINLEQRVPPNHTLRKIQEKIDFDFIYGEVIRHLWRQWQRLYSPSCNPKDDVSFGSL